MARRRKSSEVLLTGDKVDPRERFRSSTEPAAKPPKAEFLAPVGPAGRYQKVDEGGFDEGNKPRDEPAPDTEEREIPGRRPRRKPKVIDARQEMVDPEGQVWKPDSADGEARGGAAWDDDAPGGARGGTEWADDAPGSSPTEDAAAKIDGEVAPADEPAPAPEPAPKPAPAPSAVEMPAAPALPLKPATAKEQSKVLAQTVVTSMVDKMRAEAERKGSLSVADIDAMKDEFDKQAAVLTATFEESFEAYVEARERADWDQKRDFPFDRIIVKKFSHLFKEEDLSRFDRVSRRMLPGFFLALGMMLGAEAVDEYQEKCRLIVGRLRDQHGDAFDWELAYASDDAEALVTDALVTIALQFDNFERRSVWFMEIVNAHLTPAEESDKADAGWELGPAGVKHLLRALLSDLRTKLTRRTDKNELAKRHGAEALKGIVRAFKQIED